MADLVHAPEGVRVELAGRSYDILIGPGLLAEAGRLIERAVGRRRLIVVTDETVERLHLPVLTRSLAAAGLRADVVAVPAGEASKDLRRFPAFLERILALGPDRRTVLVALGGGVVGDLAGFAAATLLRGLDFVQIPTTLLAQIDSSVGGKTGVNAPQGKNLVGAFHQPALVLADLDLLRTLPRRELLAGYAEMVKYGLIGDAAFFAHLEDAAPRLLSLDPATLGAAVALCCRMKAAIVAEDEREAGRRALLNLGHTFGHAFEAETGFGDRLLHGEAVALGMAMAAALSVRLGRLDPDSARRVRRHLAAAGLPVSLAEAGLDAGAAPALLAHMAHDKKTSEGRFTFVVLDAIGAAALARGVDPAPVAETLRSDGSV
jgi:3-dehydroquinate synthase